MSQDPPDVRNLYSNARLSPPTGRGSEQPRRLPIQSTFLGNEMCLAGKLTRACSQNDWMADVRRRFIRLTQACRARHAPTGTAHRTRMLKREVKKPYLIYQVQNRPSQGPVTPKASSAYSCHVLALESNGKIGRKKRNRLSSQGLHKRVNNLHVFKFDSFQRFFSSLLHVTGL